ncbi:MAG TPA: MarR family transcriptional regulator, partial [Acidimicrobiales bacterium]|nr:MarR family transcriptional regulator [Acidimicrobiales bacterium]
PGGLAMRDLARALDITDGSATTLADRLVAKGLADRCTDPADRRVVRLVPSPRGASLIERFRRAEREAAEAALGRVDDRRLASFVEVLQALAAPSGLGEAGDRGR